MKNKKQEAKIYTYSLFDIAALLSIAKSIRQKNCTCDESQRPKAGSFNWVVFIVFEDGIEWVFRSPRKAFGLQEDIASEVLLSEVATLECLGKDGRVPVPKVYSFSPTSENDIGIPYILMSKAAGVPLSTYKWNDDGAGGTQNQTALTYDQQHKIMKQLGKVYAHMSNMRVKQIGSLYSKAECLVVGKCLYPTLVWEGRDEFDEQEIPRGPFTDPGSFYKALILAFLAHVKELPMVHHLFHAPVPVPQEYNSFQDYRTATDRWNDYVAVGSKAESLQNRLDYALVGLSLEDSVPSLVENDARIQCQGFPLCHPDLSTQNIFVDDDLNIVCIIDWAFASFVPPSMLLICPGLPHPRDRAPAGLRESFANAFVEAQGFDGEKNVEFSYGSVLWAFSRLVNFDALQDYAHFLEFKGLLSSQEAFPHLRQLKDREEYKEVSQILSAYDEEEPTGDQKQYFSCVGPERFALSQHLTVMGELNKSFLADRRLWKWMDQYLSERDSYMYSSCERSKGGRKRRFSESL